MLWQPVSAVLWNCCGGHVYIGKPVEAVYRNHIGSGERMVVYGEGGGGDGR